MNIAYLSGSTIPSDAANSVHVMKMCAAFADAGHDVTLHARQTEPSYEDPFIAYGVPRTFHLRRFRVPRLDGRSLSRKGLRALRFARRVAQAVGNEPAPDLFYARDILSLSLCLQRDAPFIYEAHEPPKHRLIHRLEARLFRHPRFERLVVISAALRERYLQLFPDLDRRKVLVAHDGADLADETTSDVGERLGDRPRIGYVGHLYPGRGIDIILRVANRLPEAEFHIVGGRSRDVQRWKHTAAGARVRFHGAVSHSQVARLLDSFDIVIAPYQRTVGLADGGDTSRWMSPLKIFEYMAAARPIVSSDLPVLREVLTHGVNGLLVPPADINAWTDAIRMLAGDPDLCRKLGDRARADLAAHYTWARRARAVLAGRETRPSLSELPNPTRMTRTVRAPR